MRQRGSVLEALILIVLVLVGFSLGGYWLKLVNKDYAKLKGYAEEYNRAQVATYQTLFDRMNAYEEAHNNHTHKNEALWALGEANVLAIEEVGKLVKQTVSDIKAELNNHGQEIQALQPPTVQLSKSPVFMVAPLPDGKFKTIPVVIETDTGIVRLMLTGESTELKVLDRYPAQADKAKVGVK